jgi:hypothetical protein
MAFQYTQEQLLSDINAGIRGKIGMLTSQTDFVNRVAREVRNDVAIRSAQRSAQLTPDLFEGIYKYTCPSDLHGNRLIDVPAQAKRYDGSFVIVPIEQFNANPRPGDISITNFNGVRQILMNSIATSKTLVIDPLSTASDWTAYGDAENLTNDAQDFISGNGSIVFDIDASAGTTAGIENAALDSIDVTEYMYGYSSAHVWVKLSNADNITNFKLRFGTDASNYYEITVTSQSDGTEFIRGWNLLRFSLNGLTATGTVDDEDINYAAVFMTKTTGKVSQTGFKMNYLVFMTGVIADTQYYSNYPWQSSTGTYKRLSTDASDVIVADEDEYELFVKKGVYLGRCDTNFDMIDREQAEKEYTAVKTKYEMENPDNSLLIISTYHQQ